MKKFAVVLSGCGVFDGAEIHESVLALLAIDEAGATYD
jgi:enhancing lycopene biosynthesis protein 2|tara:strand:- start:651 stop:764 length:114 start_codon:yes stop_codon:yes gene_type:complete